MGRMTRTNRILRRLGRWPQLILCVLLVGAGLVAAWLWISRYRPLREDLLTQQSQFDGAHVWEVRERRLKRVGWVFHDDAWFVGRLGDAATVGRLIAAAPPGEVDGCLGNEMPHLALGLAFMTNHWFKTGAEWKAWWEANRDRSQTQWMLDGFAQRNLPATLKPTVDEYFALHRALALGLDPQHPVRSDGSPERLPDWLAFNLARAIDELRPAGDKAEDRRWKAMAADQSSPAGKTIAHAAKVTRESLAPWTLARRVFDDARGFFDMHPRTAWDWLIHPWMPWSYLVPTLGALAVGGAGLRQAWRRLHAPVTAA